MIARRRQQAQISQLGSKILDAVVSHQPPGIKLKEVVETTGITRSWAQRYLNLLRAEGLVHCQRRLWYPGPPLTAIPKFKPPSQLMRRSRRSEDASS